jgi:hypothetical protein
MRLLKLLALCLLALPAVEATAQVSLRLEMANSCYIQYEAIYARVTIRNYSAHPLAFGESKELQGRLKFEIEMADGSFAAPIPGVEQPQMLGVILLPGSTQTVTFIISKYYPLQRLGKYKIKAYVEHPQLPSAYESNNAFFSVVSGNVLMERSVGVPDYVQSSQNQTIKTRKYRILDFFDGRNKIYALSVEDDRMVYAVKRLGFDMGPSLKPTCEIDALSRINIILPVSPKVSAYYVYGIDGKLEKREIYVKTNASPTLVVDKKDGSVMIVGGRIARKDLDYQEYKDLPFMESFESKPVDDEE